MDVDEYQSFLESKRVAVAACGFDVPVEAINPHLFDWQKLIVRWGLRLGRCCFFESTGLGKTRQQVAWADAVARHTGGDVLILAPLAVAQQTVREADAIGVPVRYCRRQSDVRPGVTITNYDMIHAFDLGHFAGVVLDEGSAIKAHDSQTRQIVTEGFARTPYRLSCTATPAPNDHTELGTQAEFVGAMTRQEMLSMFFVHDGGSTQDWRLKGHARGEFWRWVASWAVLIRAPHEIGYPDDRYILPPLREHVHEVGDGDWARQAGYLLAPDALSLTESRSARKASLGERVAACAELVNGTSGQWLVWCVYNQEGDALTAAIPGAVQVAGSDSREHKERAMLDFAEGKIRVMVSKASICGWGMNWQNCHRMAFVGVDHSYESYFQAVRRCWRFGQVHPVDVHLFLGGAERAVLASLQEKHRQNEEMAAEIGRHIQDTMRHNLEAGGRMGRDEYRPTDPMRLPDWLKGEAA